MLFSFADEPCPHSYFPDNPEISVIRRVVELDGSYFGYLDFYNTDNTTYFLFLFIDPAFRDGRWFLMIQEHGSDESGEFPTDVITADLKENRVIVGASARLLEVLRSGPSFVTHHEKGLGATSKHYVTGAEHFVTEPNP